MKKLGILALAIIFALPFAVFAEGENTKQSTISFDVGEASYEWSIPQSFTLEQTSATYQNSKVYRADIPVTFSSVSFPASATWPVFFVSITSANNFNLVKSNSSISYVMPDTVFYFHEAGTHTTPACTLASNIAQATDFGVHSDTLTFTVTYSPGEVGGMAIEVPEYCPLAGTTQGGE